MPVEYKSYKSKHGFTSPGFRVSDIGVIETDESLVVNKTLTVDGVLSTSSTLVGTSLQLSDIVIQGNVIKNNTDNQDLIINVDGNGTIRLQEAVQITGILTATNNLDATTTTSASAVFSGGVGIAKTLRTGQDAVINELTIGKGKNNVLGNSAFGKSTLESITTGANNTAIGFQAGGSITTGDGNTIIGYQAGDAIQNGFNNIAIGTQALIGVTSGDNNIAIGYLALPSADSNNNIAIGNGAGFELYGGDNNVIIGSADGATISGTSNNILLSDGAGNIRLSFNNTGAATFNASVSVTGNVTTNDATALSHAPTLRQLQRLALAYMMYSMSGNALV